MKSWKAITAALLLSLWVGRGGYAQEAAQAAPGRTFLGLTLDESRHEEVLGWVDEAGMQCSDSPSPARTSHRYVCERPPATVAAEQGLEGSVQQLLVVRAEDGPVHFVDAVRRYSIPEQAMAAYSARSQSLAGSLGPAGRVDAPRLPALEGRFARFLTSWGFSDLRVELVLLKSGAGYLSLSERWSLPDAASRTQERPGAGAHGAGTSRGRNPHLLPPDATPEPAPAAPASGCGR